LVLRAKNNKIGPASLGLNRLGTVSFV
jgi:hypothetical protein